MSTEPTHDLNYYYVMQLKPKNKIRKFNSLISIKPGDGRDDTRKPGFIMKRNLSVSKK